MNYQYEIRKVGVILLEELKQLVYKANMKLPEMGLVLFTWGNVSAIDSTRQYVVIKPSGVPYEQLTPENMVVVNLNGEVIEGNYRPSSDTPTHIELYKAFSSICGITHTHSKWATIWAQRGKAIKPMGTTHADYFDGAIPITRPLKANEIEADYEKNTGLVIAETFKKMEPNRMPAVLVRNHGPFTWGKTAAESVEHAAILEYVAELAAFSSHNYYDTMVQMPDKLLEKHFDRKHGPAAYYGQNK